MPIRNLVEIRAHRTSKCAESQLNTHVHVYTSCKRRRETLLQILNGGHVLSYELKSKIS